MKCLSRRCEDEWKLFSVEQVGIYIEGSLCRTSYGECSPTSPDESVRSDLSGDRVHSCSGPFIASDCLWRRKLQFRVYTAAAAAAAARAVRDHNDFAARWFFGRSLQPGFSRDRRRPALLLVRYQWNFADWSFPECDYRNNRRHGRRGSACGQLHGKCDRLAGTGENGHRQL